MNRLARLIAWMLLPFYRLKLRWKTAKLLSAPKPKLVRVAFTDDHATMEWDTGATVTYKHHGIYWYLVDGSGARLDYWGVRQHQLDELYQVWSAGVPHPLLTAPPVTLEDA